MEDDLPYLPMRADADIIPFALGNGGVSEWPTMYTIHNTSNTPYNGNVLGSISASMHQDISDSASTLRSSIEELQREVAKLRAQISEKNTEKVLTESQEHRKITID